MKFFVCEEVSKRMVFRLQLQQTLPAPHLSHLEACLVYLILQESLPGLFLGRLLLPTHYSLEKEGGREGGAGGREEGAGGGRKGRWKGGKKGFFF